MGSIRGDLNVIGFGDLLQVLAKHQHEGALSVTDAANRKTIYIGKDGLMLLSDGARKGPRIGEILLRTRRLSAQQVERVAEVQKQWKTRFGETVVRLGYLNRDEMIGAVREQVEEEIYDLFFWNNPTFEFVEGPPPSIFRDPDQPVVTLNRDVTGIVLEAMRRIDEWLLVSKPLGGMDAVFTLTDHVANFTMAYADDPILTAVVPLIDARRSVRQIVEDSRASRFQVYRALYQLHQDGGIRAVAAKPAAPAAGDGPTAKAASAGPVVVIVSALAPFRRQLADDLRKGGYEPVDAVSTQLALEIAQQQKCHAILLDAPDRLEEVWGNLLHMSAMTTTPIFVLSPSRLREDILHTIRSGARDYVVKPFSRLQLLERLQRLGDGIHPTDTTIVRRNAPDG